MLTTLIMLGKAAARRSERTSYSTRTQLLARRRLPQAHPALRLSFKALRVMSHCTRSLPIIDRQKNRSGVSVKGTRAPRLPPFYPRARNAQQNTTRARLLRMTMEKTRLCRVRASTPCSGERRRGSTAACQPPSVDEKAAAAGGEKTAVKSALWHRCGARSGQNAGHACLLSSPARKRAH
jgi:hypothetical protein